MGPWRYAVNTALSEPEKKEVTGLANTGVTGKWMLFPAPEWVRGVWADIVAATEVGRLGSRPRLPPTTNRAKAC